MADTALSRLALLAVGVTALVASGCTGAAPGLPTPSPESTSATRTDRGTTTPTPTPVSTTSATPAPAAGGTSTPASGLADIPGASTTVRPAPAAPTSPPVSTTVEVTGEVQSFIDAARVLTARGEAITSTSLAGASPHAAALIATGAARVNGDALTVYVAYAGDAAAARSAIEAAGGRIELAAPDLRLFQASVPVGRLAALQLSTAITRIRLPETPAR